MIIYADILFLLNALITYIALLLTALIMRSPLKRVRFLIASVLGGAYALSILADIPPFVNVVLKIVMCAALVFAAYGKMNVRLFMMHALLFLLINVVIGGVVLLLSLKDSRNFYSDLSVSYINVSPLTIIIALGISFVAVTLINRLALKRRHKNEIYKVSLTVAQKTYTLIGFCDTGNGLTEPFSGLPVCVVKKGVIAELETEPLKRVIPFSSVGGNGMLYGVKATVYIEYAHKQMNANTYIAESTESFSDMQYDIILNPQIFKQTEQL